MLSNCEAVLVSHLCRVGTIDTKVDPFWKDFVDDVGSELEECLTKLQLAGLAAIDPDGVMRLLTEFCQVAAMPDLGWVAGENSSGRFTRWMLNRSE